MNKGAVAALGYAPFLGIRYSFARKRNRFTSVISTVSLLGMVLGVASLIVVLSIMNGFAGELRERILSLVPHGYVEHPQGIDDWQTLAAQLEATTAIVAASPYLEDKVILGGNHSQRAAVLTAIDPAAEVKVSSIASRMRSGALDSLSREKFGVVLGASLARLLGVAPGDSVAVTVPRLTVTPLGVFPRSKRLRVLGVFEIGAQPDTYQAYVSLATGRALFGSDRVTGLQVRTFSLETAPDTLQKLKSTLPEGYITRDWSQTQGSLFRAVRMEKVMVSVLLLSVVAVAAFNIVSTLVMSVTEKRRDIAVLRTMGARPAGIIAVFMAHGLTLALAGITAGLAIGVALAVNIASITAGVERVVGVKLFDPDVYFISELPATLLWSDVAAVASASLLLGLLATLYPAWRAARIAPAEVLRYE